MKPTRLIGSPSPHRSRRASSTSRARTALSRGQATLEMLLAFAALLLVLQLLAFLTSFGAKQAFGFSDAQTRQLLAQKSLVLGVLCADGEGSSINLSILHPAFMNGMGHLLANPARTVSVMTLPEVEPNPDTGGIKYSCGKLEIPA